MAAASEAEAAAEAETETGGERKKTLDELSAERTKRRERKQRSKEEEKLVACNLK